MARRVDLGELVGEYESAEVRTFEHALSISEYALYVMEQRGMSRTQLARRMGKSKSQVTRMLSARTNMTLKSISELEVALGVDLISSPSPKWGTLSCEAGEAGSSERLPDGERASGRDRQDAREPFELISAIC